MSISPLVRRKIERLVRRVLRRERAQIASIVVYLSPGRLAERSLDYACRIVVWSPALHKIAAQAKGVSIAAAIRQVSRKVRSIVRERMERLQQKSRRHGANRVRHYLTYAAARAATNPSSSPP
jgi:hypothetical protein